MGRTFGTIGRFLAITNSIAMPGIAIWQFDQASVFALYVGFMAILVGLIEVPFLCTCMAVCVRLSKFTRIIGGYWVTRGVIYVLIASGGFAIYELQIANVTGGGPAKQDNLYLLFTQISLVCSAALYFLAQYKKEANPADGEKDGRSGGGSSAASAGGKNEAASAVGGFFGRAAVKAVKNNPEAAAAAAAAAAPSIAQQMFGGGSSSSSSSSSSSGGEPKGFYDDEESSGGYVAPSVPLTAGSSGSSSSPSSGGGFGGFFGGGKAKGGKSASSPASSPAPAPAPAPAPGSGGRKGGVYDDDLPESNPFLS